MWKQEEMVIQNRSQTFPPPPLPPSLHAILEKFIHTIQGTSVLQDQ